MLLNLCLDYAHQLILQIVQPMQPGVPCKKKHGDDTLAAYTLLALYGGNTSGGHMAISLYSSKAVLP